MLKVDAWEKMEAGEWYEGDIEELLSGATEHWDAASNDQRPYEMYIDCADLVRIITELRDRRNQDT